MSRSSADGSAYADEACYEDQIKTGFAGMQMGGMTEPGLKTRPKINGANYTAIDTGDGYHVVKDVPIFCEIPKGEHGAPYAVTKDVLELFLSTMQAEYAKGSFTGVLSAPSGSSPGHNDDFGLTHPDFAGYFIPRRVGLYKFGNGEEKWALFADKKIKNDKFAKYANAELPYHSPEIYKMAWDEHRIDVVSFLDTKPPFFRFAINTVGQIVSDPSAKFEARWRNEQMTEAEIRKLLDEQKKANEAAFDAALEKAVKPLIAKFDGGGGGGDGGGDGEGDSAAEGGEAAAGDTGVDSSYDGFDEGFVRSFPKTAKTLSKITKMMRTDPSKSKPNPLPVDKNRGGKMSLDPETAAKFTTMTNELAEVKNALAAQDAEKKAKALEAKADTELRGKIVYPAMKEQLAAFAREAASRKDGEAWFDKFVASVKPGLKEKPTNFAANPDGASDGMPFNPKDPVMSKFADEAPEAQSAAAKFGADWEQLNGTLGDRWNVDKEAYVKNELAQWKFAKAHPEQANAREGRRG